MKKDSKHSLVEERIVITTKVIILLIAVGKFLLVVLELFNVAFNYIVEPRNGTNARKLDKSVSI